MWLRLEARRSRPWLIHEYKINSSGWRFWSDLLPSEVSWGSGCEQLLSSRMEFSTVKSSRGAVIQSLLQMKGMKSITHTDIQLMFHLRFRATRSAQIHRHTHGGSVRMSPAFEAQTYGENVSVQLWSLFVFVHSRRHVNSDFSLNYAILTSTLVILTASFNAVKHLCEKLGIIINDNALVCFHSYLHTDAI